MSTLSSDEFREHFPMLEHIVHLENCSQGALSVEVEAAIAEMLESIRQQAAPWGRWVEVVEEARALFAQYIHASPDEIAILPSASTCAFQVASTLDYRRRSGIVSTELEFHSVGQVWRAQERNGAIVEYVKEHDGIVVAEDYAPLIDDDTALVSVPLVSYKNGARPPIAEVAALAREHGARVFVDAYQGAGVVPIDVRTMDCDYLVTGSLKYMLGMAGVAFLYIRGGVADEIPPTLTGWFGRPDPFDFDPAATAFPAGARRMEGGTPSIPAAYATAAALRLLAAVDPNEVWQHVQSLTAAADEKLRGLGVRMYSPADERYRGPQVAVLADDAEDLGRFLAERSIMASPRGKAVRLAMHYYTTMAEVDATVAAVAEYFRA